jgi:hypothetical protein
MSSICGVIIAVSHDAQEEVLHDCATCTSDWTPTTQYQYASFSLVEPSLYFTRIESPKITSPVSLLANTMAPIPIPIGLRFPENIAAPSPNKRASRSTTDPRVIIGIVVAVVCFVGFIGTACYIWRKRRRAKSMGLGEVEYAELDTTWAGAEITHRRVSELDGSSIAAPTYTRPSELVFPETASLLPTPGVWTPRSSHGEQILVSPEQVLQCDKRSYFGRLPIDQGKSELCLS